ncbi:MAG: hypothetical protein AAB638_03230, partial [Patescibacteria group bacterium]
VSDAATVTGSVSTTTKAKVLHNSTLNSQVLVQNLRNIITGTSTFSTSSNIVTGTGTLYTTELVAGDYIWLESSQTWQQVSSIASSTELTLSATSTIAGSGQSSVRGKSNFQSGEQLQVNGSNYIVISNTGDSAIATAKIDGVWTNPDTTAVTIDGWTTTSTNYIKIYTTSTARHQGKWDSAKYNLTATSGTVLNINEENVVIDGLQIHKNSNIATTFGVDFNNTTGVSNFTLSNTIIKGNTNFTATPQSGIAIVSNTGSGIVKLYNNIVYNFKGVTTSTIHNGIIFANSNYTIYAYNNTFYNLWTSCYRQTAGIFIAKNSIAQSCNDGFMGTFSTSSDYNISDIAGDAPNATFSTSSITVSFVSTSTSDFHLSPTDSSAKDMATSSPATDPNLSFTTDIDGQTRTDSWDIGADEFVNTAPNAPVGLGQYTSGCSSSISTSTYWIATSTACFMGVISDSDLYDLEKLQ